MKGHDEIAIEYQSKFRFYFVALVFTLLAASVQSAPLSEMSYLSKVLEIIGWFSLLTCGLLSLSYLEFSSVIYNHLSVLDSPTLSDQEKIEFNEQLEGIKEKSSFKYLIAKYSFAVGLILIILSRAIYGLCGN